MAAALRQKKFKVEITLTVAMEEVDAELFFSHQLQQALLQDETVLSRLMLSAALYKLQGYADYLAAQDDLLPLRKAEHALEPMNQPAPSGVDFAGETRALRTCCLDVQINSSAIREEVRPGKGEGHWQPVWRDLRPESPLGRLFERLAIPTTPLPYAFRQQDGHALRVRYLTRQRDGIHVEGRCTCQEAFEGVGRDECQALDNLWNNYKAHNETSRLAERFQGGWEIRLRPGKQ